MKDSYNGVAVPKDGVAIEYGEGASQGKTPPFARDARFVECVQGRQDGAPGSRR